MEPAQSLDGLFDSHLHLVVLGDVAADADAFSPVSRDQLVRDLLGNGFANVDHGDGRAACAK